MFEPFNVKGVLEFIGYDDDPATVLSIRIGLLWLTVYRLDGQVRYFETLPQPDGSIKLTDHDITWDIEWEILMTS